MKMCYNMDNNNAHKVSAQYFLLFQYLYEVFGCIMVFLHIFMLFCVKSVIGSFNDSFNGRQPGEATDCIIRREIG